jgi:hypothetical protein
MTRAALLALALLATACAEKWQKPGATEAEFRAMAAECAEDAAAQAPPLLREQVMVPARWFPPQTSCGPRGCITYPGYWIPPQTMLVDDNLGRRAQARRACYMAQGWQPAKD